MHEGKAKGVPMAEISFFLGISRENGSEPMPRNAGTTNQLVALQSGLLDPGINQPWHYFLADHPADALMGIDNTRQLVLNAFTVTRQMQAKDAEILPLLFSTPRYVYVISLLSTTSMR